MTAAAETETELIRRLHRLVASDSLDLDESPLVKAVGLETGRSAGRNFRERQTAAIEHVARQTIAARSARKGNP